MREFPQTVLYRSRITLSVVEFQINTEYNKSKPQRPIIGEFSSNEFNFETIDDKYLPLYQLISRYYRNAEIGYDTVDEFLLRFNDKWHNTLYKYQSLLDDTGNLQIGSSHGAESKTTDKNTILHGYTDTYKRNGKNTTGTNGESKSQNSVTQLEKGVSNATTETEYGEGATTERKMNGETDTRETDNTRKMNDLEAADIRQYLEKTFGQIFIDEFHDLFMEVLD